METIIMSKPMRLEQLGFLKFKRLLATVSTTAIVAILGTSTAQSANLLTNSSFEDTTNFVDQGNDTMDLDVGSTAMPG